MGLRAIQVPMNGHSTERKEKGAAWLGHLECDQVYTVGGKQKAVMFEKPTSHTSRFLLDDSDRSRKSEIEIPADRTHYVAVCVGKAMRLDPGEYKTTTVPSVSCPSSSLALIYLERALPTSPDFHFAFFFFLHTATVLIIIIVILIAIHSCLASLLHC